MSMRVLQAAMALWLAVSAGICVAQAQADPRQTIASYRAFAAAQARLMEQLKANIAEKRKLERQYAELDTANAKHEREIETMNAFCKGRFEPAEYRRRLKICEDKQRALNARAAAINKVRGVLDAKDEARRKRALKLEAEYDALDGRAKALETAMARDPAFSAVMQRCKAEKELGARSACIASNWVPPKPGKAVYLLDALEAGKGDWKRSVAILKDQLRADPNNVALRDALSYVTGLYEGHLALSSLGNVRYKKGVLAWMEGDYEDAALNFSSSYEIDPTDKGALSAFGFVSGLDQARKIAGLLAPCHLLPDCDPLFYAREFAIQLDMPTGYRLLDEKDLKLLYRLRVVAQRHPEDLKLRATLNYVEGLSAWDSFRDAAMAEARQINNMPDMVRALTRMGRGEYQAAIKDFAHGLNEKWGEDGLAFSYFHAMGLNEGSQRGSADSMPPLWDPRMKKAYDEIWEEELTSFLLTPPGGSPPWAFARAKLRQEEVAAWSRFLADPF